MCTQKRLVQNVYGGFLLIRNLSGDVTDDTDLVEYKCSLLKRFEENEIQERMIGEILTRLGGRAWA